MPPRSNPFQDTIAIVHRHLAGDATVEESAMLWQPTTGVEREVDVVLRSKVGPHEVIVSIEARATTRKADLPWVESMVAKHADLPTSQLVLVSESGFTRPAKRHAEVKGAIAVSPADLAGDHPGRQLLDAIHSLGLRAVSLEVQHMVMVAQRPNGQQVQVRVPLNMNVYSRDGQYLTMLYPLFEAEREANEAAFQKALPEQPGSATELQARLHPCWNLPGGIAVDDIYARWETSDPPEMQRIAEVLVIAEVAVEEVPTIEMTARQLDDVAYAYGETTLGGQRAVVVATADETGGVVTIRPQRR